MPEVLPEFYLLKTSALPADIHLNVSSRNSYILIKSVEVVDLNSDYEFKTPRSIMKNINDWASI